MARQRDPLPSVAEPCMSPDNACAYLGGGISARTLRRLGVPCFKLGHLTFRYRQSDLDAWIQSKRVGQAMPLGHSRVASIRQPFTDTGSLRDALVLPKCPDHSREHMADGTRRSISRVNDG